MNYRRIYDLFIADRRSKPPQGYKERHHIIPRAFGGSDDADNLVDLSPGDHYFAHRLLAKIYGGRMLAALFIMVNKPLDTTYGGFCSRRVYHLAKCQYLQWASENYSGQGNPNYGNRWSDDAKIAASERFKGRRSGSKNPMYGRTFSDEHRKKISEGNKGKHTGKKFKHSHRKAISQSLLRFYENNLAPNTGRKHSESTKRKIAIKRIDQTTYTFFNPNVGTHVGTRRSLVDRYALRESGVSSLISGTYKSTNGWRLLK